MAEAPKQSKRTNRKFTQLEDKMLKRLVRVYGEKSWEEVATHMKNRNARQCHDRWRYYLCPRINKNPWTQEEDERLIKEVSHCCGKWVKIAKKFKGRTDTQIKNRWNTLKKSHNLMTPKRPQKDIKDPNDLTNEESSEIISSLCDQIKQMFNQSQIQSYNPDFDLLF